MNRPDYKNDLHSLQRLADGRYIWLNRFGMPIGVPDGVYINIEDYENFIYAYCITPGIAQTVSFNGDPCTNKITLYNAFNSPYAGCASNDRDFARRRGVVDNLLVFESAAAAQWHWTERMLGADPTEAEILATLRHEPVLYAIAMLVHDAPVGKPRCFEGSVRELHSAILSTELHFWAAGQRMIQEDDAFSAEDLATLLECPSNIDLLGDLRVNVSIADFGIDYGGVAPYLPVTVKVPDTPENSCIA